MLSGAWIALRRRPLRLALGAALVALAALVAWRMALAASITVTTTADTVDGNTTSIAALQASPGADGLISLREAVTAAINGAGTGPHTVVLPAGTYNLASTLNITAAVIVQGAGAGTTIVSGQNARQVLNVTGALTIADLAVRHGRDNVGGCINGNGGSLTATNVTIGNCVALYGAGGGIHATSTAISFTSVTLQSATGNNDGGGIYLQNGSLTVASSTFSGNTSNNGSGGAVYLAGAANASFTDTSFSSNLANNNGAGVAMSSSGTLALTRVTFHANGTNNGSGGLHVGSGSATLVNVTVSGNSGANGGGMAVSGGSATLTNVTVASNSATTNYGVGGLYRSGGTLSLANTLVANNTNTSGASNCSGGITNTSNNLDSGTSCGFGSTNGSLSSSNPLLSALASNGGATQTMALGAGSPAINAGTAAGAPAADQRGTARSGATDIGAYEYAAAATYAIGGTVFEDVNYGGGAGRSLASSGGVGVNGATVELYSSGGVYVSSTTTAGGGAYSFTGLAAGSYHVRVVNSSVPSQRSGATGTLRGVMTYRTTASSGSAVAVTDFVGGTNPALVDPGAGSSGATFNTGTGVFSAVLSGTAQSVAPVTLSSANITGVDFGFNFDTVVNTNDSGQGSLRQAITNANTLGGDASLAQSGRTAAVEAIVFMISNGSTAGGGSLGLSGGLRSGFNYFATAAGSYNVATIAALSALPTIGSTLVLDAQTQPGWTLHPIVELNGAAAGSTSGLSFSAANNVLRGFVVNRFTGSGLSLSGAGNTVAGNWIGLNAAGTAASANTSRGLHIAGGGNNTIGGATAAERNVFSGNGNHGLYAANGNSNVIVGNYFGTNAAGSAAVPNGGAGLYLHSLSSTNTVGGAAAGQGNVMSGNTQEGVVLRGGVGGNVFRGNVIGMNAAGTAALANSVGIALSATGNNNTIGGTGANDGNLIAGNTGAGIAIFGTPASRGDAILGNSIHSNGGPGIDLGTAAGSAGDGITLNTGVKTSGQPNLLMNYPVFTGASLAGTTLTVAGYVGSAPNQSSFASSRVEVFISDASSAHGSGRTYLGYVTADASGNFNGTLAVPGGVTLTPGSTRLTGTATDTSNNTSEFGPNHTYGRTIAGTVFEDVHYGGGAGRSLAASGGAPVNGATVELYDASGVFVSSTTTAGAGSYSFASLAAGSYLVRVVSSSVASTRSGSSASLRGVLTYRTTASSGTAVAVTDFVGGTNPALVDPGAASAGASFNPATGVYSAVLSGTAHAYASVNAASAGVGGVDFGFNFDTVVNTNDSGQGSLRQAIANANALSGDASLVQSGRPAAIENLVFMIPNGSAAAGLRSTNNLFSGGIATIAPTSALPTVSAPLVLDAQTQPGWGSGPIVELNGSGAGSANGLTLTAAASVVRGWVINRFALDGLRGAGVGNLVIQGNHIGTTASGNAAAPNLQRGIYVSGGSNQVVGGTQPAQRNVVSGNGGRGITIAGGSAHVVQGNRIGVGADGSTVLPNGGFGLLMQSGASNSTVGGTVAAAANLIRGNTRGLQIDAGVSGIAVLGNAIYGNAGLGINLGAPGPNLNDGVKTAGQANLMMDAPVVTSARARGNQLTVAGYVGTAAGQSAFGGARVEFFVSDAAASGFGEGQTYLGYLTADASGNFSGTLTMAVATLRLGTRLTGTATDAAGNTSEFGANFNGLIVDFVVNSNLDEADTSAGDGQCLTASGVCTLRAAIAELNAWATLAATPLVAFAMPSCPGAGCTIAPTSALPTVSRAMTIDAQTQPGWTLAPIVELLGSGAGATHGLHVGAAGSTVRGFAIGGFGPGGHYAGVYVNAGNTTVEGNYIGLAADGSTARPNGSSGATSGGVHVASGSASVIGGTTAAQRNVLSGNGGAGIWLDAGTATVIGNYIGTDAAGSVAIGNRRGGVQIAAGTHQIGGAAGGQGNVISGNAFAGAGGIVVASAGHTIQGNTVGLDATRTSAVPNGDGSSTDAAGIDLRAGATHVLIGGTAAGEGNVIAGNDGHGVRVLTPSARVLGNSIHANQWLGIDLGADGITANDGLLPGGSTPARGIDFPVVTGAGYDAGTGVLTLAGYVGTGTGQAAFAGARLEFFTAEADSSGHGEGREYVGSLTADSSGRFYGSVTVPGGVSFGVGVAITATATLDAGLAAGATSEFGPNFTTTSPSALAPSRFNAFETATAANALGGAIKTMTAGSAHTLALVAIDQAGSGLAPAFNGSVSLQWMDARDASGALDAGGCRASWVAAGSAGNANFVNGTPRMEVVLTPAAVGREWRLRMSHTTAGGSVVSACSTDAFAVKPASLAMTAVGSADSSTAGVGGSARSLTNGGASGGVVHRAGRPFSLRAQALDAAAALAPGYDGSATVAIVGCVLPASGCTVGSLLHAGAAPLLAASAGVIASDAMSYGEVGAITLRLTDASFADVDTADSSAAERLVQSADVVVGRFVPDHYAASVTTAGVLATANAGCTAAGAGYTFFGQAFGWSVAPQFDVTALNAQGAVTTNWTGALMKIVPASHVAQSLALAGVAGASLAQTHGAMTLTDLGSGVARLSAQASASFSVSRDPTTPVAGTAPGFGWAAAIVDDSEAAVTGNGSTTGTATQAGVAFDAGNVFHTGRLALMPGHGDARTGVRLLVELQRYTAAGWVTMTEDRGCVAVSPANVTVANPQGVFASRGLCAAPDTAAVTLRGGRAWIALPGTPEAAPGRLTAGLNVGTATSGLACQSAGVTMASAPMNLPHLLGAWGGVATLSAEPRAALTWGRANRDMVLTRER